MGLSLRKSLKESRKLIYRNQRICPRLHDLAALIKQVGPLIRSSDRVFRSVHQAFFPQHPVDSGFGAPRRECRPHAVYGECFISPQPFEFFADAPSVDAWSIRRVCEQAPRRQDGFDDHICLCRQWNSEWQRLAIFTASGRYGPRRGGRVKFGGFCIDKLLLARRRQGAKDDSRAYLAGPWIFVPHASPNELSQFLESRSLKVSVHCGLCRRREPCIQTSSPHCRVGFNIAVSACQF